MIPVNPESISDIEVAIQKFKSTSTLTASDVIRYLEQVVEFIKNYNHSSLVDTIDALKDELEEAKDTISDLERKLEDIRDLLED